MDYMTLSAEVRTESGKKFAKQLRAEGKLPAVMYNSKGVATMLSVNEAEFTKVWKQATPTTLIKLTVGKDTMLAFIKDTEYDIITDKNLHVDFHVIDEDKPLVAEIKLQLGGSPVGVREGGVLQKGRCLAKSGLISMPKGCPELSLSAIDSDVPEIIRLSGFSNLIRTHYFNHRQSFS